MPRDKQTAPPRPLAPGDVVAAHSPDLGEWTAAQITGLDVPSQTASVLELDWSGPEPTSVDDLGDVAPLRLTHHAWNGTLSFCNQEWILPRSHKVVGALPLLHAAPATHWASGWHLGAQLARQRRWDSGLRDEPAPAWKAEYTGAAVDALLGRPGTASRGHAVDDQGHRLPRLRSARRPLSRGDPTPPARTPRPSQCRR